MNSPICMNCSDDVAESDFSHWKEHEDHRGLCCDCMDLKSGMPIEILNEERIAAGKPPYELPWLGRSYVGNKQSD